MGLVGERTRFACLGLVDLVERRVLHLIDQELLPR